MLIGLVGKKRVGKDTIFNIIKENYPNARRIAFADALKESAAQLLNIPIDQIDMFKMNSNIKIRMIDEGTHPINFTGLVDMTMREFLQRYGTESHRDVFGTDFWVDEALPKIFFDSPEAITVVTDCRFKNEVERIRWLNGKVWYVTRPGLILTDGHASEVELESIEGNADYIINNDGNLVDLEKKVLTTLNDMYESR
jgi:deoxynucleotide monophosphate kinase-like protein